MYKPFRSVTSVGGPLARNDARRPLRAQKFRRSLACGTAAQTPASPPRRTLPVYHDPSRYFSPPSGGSLPRCRGCLSCKRAASTGSHPARAKKHSIDIVPFGDSAKCSSADGCLTSHRLEPSPSIKCFLLGTSNGLLIATLAATGATLPLTASRAAGDSLLPNGTFETSADGAWPTAMAKLRNQTAAFRRRGQATLAGQAEGAANLPWREPALAAPAAGPFRPARPGGRHAHPPDEAGQPRHHRARR